MDVDESDWLDAEQTVDLVMRLRPPTIRAFLDRRMRCVGCVVGRLHTVRDVCEVYELDLQAFLAELRRSASMAQP